MLEHKSDNISETRKVKRKSYYGRPIGTHQRSFKRCHPRPPIRPALPQYWGFATPTENSIAIIKGMRKADFKFGRYIHRVHPNESPLNILEKRECWRIQGLPDF